MNDGPTKRCAEIDSQKIPVAHVECKEGNNAVKAPLTNQTSRDSKRSRWLDGLADNDRRIAMTGGEWRHLVNRVNDPEGQ